MIPTELGVARTVELAKKKQELEGEAYKARAQRDILRAAFADNANAFKPGKIVPVDDSKNFSNFIFLECPQNKLKVDYNNLMQATSSLPIKGIEPTPPAPKVKSATIEGGNRRFRD